MVKTMNTIYMHKYNIAYSITKCSPDRKKSMKIPPHGPFARALF